MALAYLSLTRRISDSRVEPNYFYAVDASIARDVIAWLQRQEGHRLRKGRYFEVRLPGGVDDEWLICSRGIVRTKRGMELAFLRHFRTRLTELEVERLRILEAGACASKKVKTLARFAHGCQRYEDECYMRHPEQDTRKYVISVHDKKAGWWDLGLVVGNAVAHSVALRCRIAIGDALGKFYVRKHSFFPEDPSWPTANSRMWKEVLELVREERRARGWSAPADNFWMWRFRNTAARFGVSFDDLGDNDVEQLARRVGIPADRIGPSLAFEEIEGAVIEWARRERNAASSRGTPGDGGMTGTAVDLVMAEPEPTQESAVDAGQEMEAEAGGATAQAGRDAGETTHSADFTTVRWCGEEYVFSPGQQARAVEQLWAEYEKGGLGLSEKTIGDKIGSDNKGYRLIHTFRNHPAWRVMIKKVQTGVYRLEKPGITE